MSAEQHTVGDLIALFLHHAGVRLAFGVISIHNMPILDALGRQQQIRFIPSRGEAGAVNMADAASRVSGQPAVAFTSTGTAAGNAAGAMVEALTAGTPLLHITGQVDSPYVDRHLGFIHEARDQLTMLKSVSKAAFRITNAGEAWSVLRQAWSEMLTAPAGPVSVEIPADIQISPVELPAHWDIPEIPSVGLDVVALQPIVEHMRQAKRPLIWLGGGARHASAAVQRLAQLNIGFVSSTQGRGILPENHPLNLGAFNQAKPVEAFYQTCDAMLVVGSQLRSNETLRYSLQLPRPLFQVDANPEAANRVYSLDGFAHGDAEAALSYLADHLQGYTPDPGFATDLQAAKRAAKTGIEAGVGVYTDLIRGLEQTVGDDFVWVRDVTLSNSIWGNRFLELKHPRNGVHALGGGIGQGLAMGIGAALAAAPRKTLILCGDGGLQLNLGELATAVQEGANFTMLLMNSQGYGVIKNIQDAHYGSRYYYSDLQTPDFGKIAAGMGMYHERLTTLGGVAERLRASLERSGPQLLEFDMTAIGDFKTAFAGPPVRK